MPRKTRPDGATLPLFPPKSEWTAPSLADLPNWAEAKRVAVDVETHDPHLKQLGIGVRRGGYVAGISFAIEDGPCAYLPIRHRGGGNLPEASVRHYLLDQARAFRGEIIGANLSYDLDYLLEEGIKFHPYRFRDVQVVDSLLRELHDSYSLQAISQRFDLPGKEEEILHAAAKAYGVSDRSGMAQLPAAFVGPYAEQDARLPLLILRRQEKLLHERDLLDIYDLESRVIPALLAMRRRGVRIDLDKLEYIEEWSRAQEAEALREIRRQTDIEIPLGEVWKTGVVAPALRAAGVELKRTSTGQPSIKQDALKDIEHPAVQALLRARKMNKLRTTFAESVRRHMVNNRLHPTFNQTRGEERGARYGRLSCANPNLQQQPSRDEFADEWRSIYVPEPGTQWACLDYSQQEPRWTTHFAAILELKGAQEAVERYKTDPKLDNHQFMADLTGLPRKLAKNIFLGLCYGEGGAKLCAELGLPTRWALSVGRERRVSYHATRTDALRAAQGQEHRFVWKAAGEEGQKILDQFNERVPYVRELARRAERKAKRTGFIRTVGGRQLHFPVGSNGAYEWTHKALNRLIQGSSADQTKAAMVALHEEMPDFYMQLQVHDEIDASVLSKGDAEKAAQIMRECIPALLPFRVDVELGPSWGEVV